MNTNEINTAANEIADAQIFHKQVGDLQSGNQLNKLLLRYNIDDRDYLQDMYASQEYKQLLLKYIKAQLTNEAPTTPSTTTEEQPTTNEQVTNTNQEEIMEQEQQSNTQQTPESSESQAMYQQLKTAYDSNNYRTIQKALKAYRQYRGGSTTFKLNAKKEILKQVILDAFKYLTEVQAIEQEEPDTQPVILADIDTVKQLVNNKSKVDNTPNDVKQAATKRPTYNRKHYLKGKLSSLLTPAPRNPHLN